MQYNTNVSQPVYPPMNKLKTDRSLLTFILLSLVTFGIYGLYVWCQLGNEINLTASRADGKKTMHFLPAMLLGAVTFGIYPLVWMHNFSERVGSEAARRNTSIQFGAADFWIWNVLLACILVGPFVYMHRLLQATNAVNTSYNMYG